MFSLQALTGLLVPLAGLALRFAATYQRGSLSRRLREHARVRQALKSSDQARDALDELLATEATAFRDRELYLLRRKLDGGWLGVSILFLLVTGGVGIAIVNWIMLTWGSWWVVLSLGLGSIVVILLIAFTAVGFAGIWKDPDAPKPEDVAPAT